ncbi:MAG: aminotransferase class V-fold PLP-dependent enzyme [Bacteroidia bacterium]
MRVEYSFQPGPSQVHPAVYGIVKEIYERGFLGVYHRSDFWRGVYKKAQASLRAYLELPLAYEIAFTAGATHSWQIVIDAFWQGKVMHLVGGAFGQRWYELGTAAAAQVEAVDVFSMQEGALLPANIVAAVHVETSNGSWLPQLSRLRELIGGGVVFIDATSSLGGLRLPWEVGDVWLASVQKCLGMPSGLGVLIYRRGIERHARDIRRYDAFMRLVEYARKGEPLHTPNLLGLWVAAQLPAYYERLEQVEKRLHSRAARIKDFFRSKGFQLVVPEKWVSPTVLCFEGEKVSLLGAELLRRGIMLGEGYGAYKEKTFRIANFPALADAAYEVLFQISESCLA